MVALWKAMPAFYQIFETSFSLATRWMSLVKAEVTNYQLRKRELNPFMCLVNLDLSLLYILKMVYRVVKSTTFSLFTSALSKISSSDQYIANLTVLSTPIHDHLGLSILSPFSKPMFIALLEFITSQKQLTPSQSVHG